MAYKDLQPQKVVLSEMSLTQNKLTLITNLINNSQALAQKHNALTDEVEATFTQLKEFVDASQLADDVDIDKINETLTAVNSLLSEAGAGANILAGMGQVYAELNRREETKTIDVVVTDASGTLEVSRVTLATLGGVLDCKSAYAETSAFVIGLAVVTGPYT